MFDSVPNLSTPGSVSVGEVTSREKKTDINGSLKSTLTGTRQAQVRCQVWIVTETCQVWIDIPNNPYIV
jgi:hypothetical protein